MLAALNDDRRGSSAVEMALVTPLLMILLFGSIEVGNYFMNEHRLVKSVRDGARFAARQGFPNYTTCDVQPTGTVYNDTLNVVKTGQVSGGTDRLPRWAEATFIVTTRCRTTGGTETYGGIYTGMANGARFVEVRATVPYRSVLGNFGINALTLSLNADQQAAVAGI